MNLSDFGVYGEKLTRRRLVWCDSIAAIGISLFAPANGSLSLIAEAIAKTLLPPKTQVFGACLKQDKIGPRGSGIARIGINVSTE